MLNEQNLVKVNCTIEQETSKAILIVVDDQKCWLPKSIITWDDVGMGTRLSPSRNGWPKSSG